VTTVFEQFRSYSPVRQVVLIIAFVAILGGALGAAWYAWLRTPYQPLFSALRPSDAATIVAELDRQKIPYRLDDGGASISVPADRADAIRLNVMTQDLPLKGTVGFELFNKSDLGLTDFVQRINYQRALQGELERTIMKLDGVDTARVHLALGEETIFRDDRVPPKASVSIRMKAGALLSDSAVQGIQKLVSAAVPKLEAANVVILDEKGQLLGGKGAGASIAAATAPSLHAKGDSDQSYEGRPAPEPAQQPGNDIVSPPQSLGAAAAGSGLVVLLAGVLWLIVRQLRGPRRLTERQRADFAAKLRAVLEEGNPGVATRS
jgi:flagellar M-ring protein FliF